jgi:hypothetical protein
VPNVKFLSQFSSTPVGFVTAKDSALARPLTDAVNALIADGAYAKILKKCAVTSSGIQRSQVNPPATLGPARLFDRDDVDQAYVGVLGQQIRSNLAQCGRDLAAQMRLPAVLVIECVENAVRGVVDPERVPGHGAGFGDGDRPALFQERPKVRSPAWFSFQQNQESVFDAHGPRPFVGPLKPMLATDPAAVR